MTAAALCDCTVCVALDRANPHAGRQLRLISSGGRPEAAPLTDPDTPAPDRAGASAPEGRPVKTCARGRTPETAHA